MACCSCQNCLNQRTTRKRLEASIKQELRENDRCTRCLENTLRYLGDPGPSRGATTADALLCLPLSIKMAEIKEDFGMVASPEWFEEDIAKGIF